MSVMVFLLLFKLNFSAKLQTFRYVANRLSEMGETAMSPDSSTDMTDVDMASIAEDELSEKFSVQGIATGKTSGKTKIVRIYHVCVEKCMLGMVLYCCCYY